MKIDKNNMKILIVAGMILLYVTLFCDWQTWYWGYQKKYPKKERKKKKKIDPNKEIIKHLTKICKNKKWV